MTLKTPLRLALALALPLAAASQIAAATTGPTVKIDNFTFGPMAVTVPLGGTVTWVNDDDIPHTVVAEDHSFRSKPLDTDDKYTFTFSKAGTYLYFCSLHPKMIGKIIVTGP
ncbi:MAG: cupredoxin domain-containing protein [Caulobacteraceae bacterium]